MSVNYINSAPFDVINTILHQTDLKALLNFGATCAEFHGLVSSVFHHNRDDCKTLFSRSTQYSKTAGISLATLKTEFAADLLFHRDCFAKFAAAVSKKVACRTIELLESGGDEISEITKIIQDDEFFKLLEEHGFSAHYADELLRCHQESGDDTLYFNAILFAIESFQEKHHLQSLKILFDRLYTSYQEKLLSSVQERCLSDPVLAAQVKSGTYRFTVDEILYEEDFMALVNLYARWAKATSSRLTIRIKLAKEIPALIKTLAEVESF
ncbi:hypothetical protein [Estrella lausannensis]|uniref:F-box domain-containing protein n=1 Tax=Estrella lausannensis TaxID=483423 RepID=A0A0H5DR82_9BACT|nr:hypothetical protein [Estrella lausannensis]CRX38164.1 hypothetical protein ELAC_0815 [Estrella lausannensis]